MNTAELFLWILDNLNYWVVTLFMAIESSFVPFPSEVVVPPAAWKAMDPDSGMSFILVSFMGGTAGTFYRQFGITMAISIAFSALNALTLSPALCAIFLKPHDSEHKQKKMSMVDRFHTSFNAAYDSLLKSYKKRVVFFIHKKWLSFGLVAASIVLLMFFMKTHKSRIGKGLINMLMFQMYGDEKLIYREYVQNARDAINDAVNHGILGAITDGRISITINTNSSTT
jgi:hypothetical protein